MVGVSIIIPAFNAERTIADCLYSAINLRWHGDLEIIVINDGSSDKTAEVASSFPGVRVVNVSNGGAPRATNIGIRVAHHDIVVSLDADAVLEERWLDRILPSFDEQGVAAVGGYALTANKTVIGKLMGYDVELRLDRTPTYTDHLYTMNTAYRRQPLLEVGMFSEEMKIAYDADISRKLKAAGYRLVLKKDARCTHYWRDDLKGYLKQQYNYAYYRLEITRKFKRSYDRVAGIGMILHVPFTAVVLLAATLGILASPFMLLLLLTLPLMHLPETARLLARRREVCILALPFLFTLRNFAWTWAAVVWTLNGILSKLKRGEA